MFQYEEVYRQGEILIFKVKEFPRAYEKGRIIKSGVIREGEKEGHEHKLEGGCSTLSLFGGDEAGTIEVKEPTTLVHPEHKPIELPKGKFIAAVQKEATGRNTHTSVKD